MPKMRDQNKTFFKKKTVEDKLMTDEVVKRVFPEAAKITVIEKRRGPGRPRLDGKEPGTENKISEIDKMNTMAVSFRISRKLYRLTKGVAYRYDWTPSYCIEEALKVWLLKMNEEMANERKKFREEVMNNMNLDKPDIVEDDDEEEEEEEEEEDDE